MAQASQANTSKLVFESQIRECYGRVVYTHKIQEKCADILLARQSLFRNGQIFLSAVTTGGIVGTLLGDSNAGIYTASITSTLLLIINAYLKGNDWGKIAQQHRTSAAQLWLIRERYFSLLTDIAVEHGNMDSWISRRDFLLDELGVVHAEAPSTNSRAYRLAQKALKVNEELTFSDREIDVFLPKELRRT